MDSEPIFPLITLDEIAHREHVPALWTDKRSPNDLSRSKGYVCHDYLKIYDREFSKWRHKPIEFLEIGLNVGASIKMWLQYFDQAHITGMDIIDFQFAMPVDEELLKRFTFYKGSAFSPYDLQKFVEAHPALFDIIIDDGCHFSGPIIMAFNYLWAHVKPGGYYVIEDLGEVRNPESHSPGYPTQIEFAESLLGRVIHGRDDIEEAFVSKELVILRKKA